MVGVKGKYKGCNTCRERRVKCDNERPVCKKCTDTGRECAGYERETVFIVGTLQGRGRVSSHPPRNLQLSGSSSAAKRNAPVRAAAGGPRTAAGPPSSASASASPPATVPSAGSSSAVLPGPGARLSVPAQLSAAASVTSSSPRSTAGGSTPPVIRHSSPQTTWNHQHQSQPQLVTDQLPKPDLVAVPPLENAWRRFLTVTERSRIDQTTGQLLAASEPDQMELVVLNTSFHSLIRNPDFCRNLNLGPDWFGLTFPRYAPPRVNVGREEDFDLRCEVMVNVPPPTTPPLLPHMTQAGSRGSFGTASGPRGELVCLFVFEHNGCSKMNTTPIWRLPADVHALAVKRLGPDHFRHFPAHHFFTRVYRHSSIMTALLNRKSSFLSGPEWILGPWESHPKSQFDKLFDCIAPIPAFLWRCDNLLREAPSIPRRLKAQDLLANCLTGEKSFHRWFEDYETEFKGRPMYEVTSSTLSRENIPFTETYTFADNFTATTLTYFWTGLIALHGCIDAVNAVATDAPAVTAVNTYPPHQAPHVYYPQQRHTPPNAAVQVANAARYSPAAILEGPAAHVCRSLDFALRTTTQPDLLAPPLLVVRAFYHSLLLARAANYHEPGASTSPQLELEWCDRFAERLAAKGQEIVDLVQRRYWTEIASF